MKVILTAADLANPRLEPLCNPVAKAIMRAMPAGAAAAHATPQGVSISWLAWRFLPLPPVAERALRRMAAGQKVEPFEFHLPDAFVTLPAQEESES